MSVRASTWAWGKIEELQLPHGEAIVLLRLADHAGFDDTCYPGDEHLARFCGLSPRRIQDKKRALETKGLLERERRDRTDGGRGRRSDLIRLLIQSDEASGEDQPDTAGASTGQTEPDQPDKSGEGSTYREPSKQPSEEPSTARPEVERLCELQLELAQERTDASKKLKITESWRTEMRRLLDRDGRTEEQIEYVIRWVHADAFWGPNVLSVPKLREQFDKLVARIKSDGQKATVTEHPASRRIRERMSGGRPTASGGFGAG